MLPLLEKPRTRGPGPLIGKLARAARAWATYGSFTRLAAEAESTAIGAINPHRIHAALFHPISRVLV